MLGLFLNNPGDLQLKELTSEDPLNDYEVKIKSSYGGICGSDISVYKGKMAHANYPVTPGHEIVGEIIKVGKEAKFKAGDKVVVAPNSFCGECEYCLKGMSNICEHKVSLGINVNGVFAQEFTISSKYVLRVPNELPDEKAVLIEPFAVIVHAFQKFSLTKETSIAIIGCGTEGMLAITLAHHLGAQVTAIDINPTKLEKIRNSFKGIKTVLPSEMTEERFDVVIEAAGTRDSVEHGIQHVKPGGTMVLIGLTPEANFPVMQMVRKELTIHGSIIYNFPTDFSKAVDYLLKDDFDVAPIISKVFHFNEFNKAYDDALSGQYGKIILNFKEDNVNEKISITPAG
ncbi:zinc-dependent alcohol dehydrogenase [Neobacillus ginsengisoli]|uniref:L-iditol 2-dehydrogenase n=1 Tax=Neobacillus ginsengisoli TaxID=904295 RepID=A0ABT9Y051_9BACI|nr:alcohol dehydrogenase catalytic domain-containing protein [Neobacillus ginsengisoli]MDQ0201188.1 L-iditol 2-dehydrogenase [Neobacillus ginsengisoli]